MINKCVIINCKTAIDYYIFLIFKKNWYKKRKKTKNKEIYYMKCIKKMYVDDTFLGGI